MRIALNKHNPITRHLNAEQRRSCVQPDDIHRSTSRSLESNLKGNGKLCPRDKRDPDIDITAPSRRPPGGRAKQHRQTHAPFVLEELSQTVDDCQVPF